MSRVRDKSEVLIRREVKDNIYLSLSGTFSFNLGVYVCFCICFLGYLKNHECYPRWYFRTLKNDHNLVLAYVDLLVGALTHNPKGCGFDSRSGHMPRVQARSQVRVCAGDNRSMFLSHIDIFFLFLPPFPSL